MSTLKRIKIVAATGIVIALAITVSAQAQSLGMGPYGRPGGPTWGGPGPAARGPAAFGEMDRDGDGYLSANEPAQHRAKRIATRAAEGRPLRNAANAPAFEQWDSDSDGSLSPGELALGRQAFFERRRGMMPGPAYGARQRQGFAPGGGPCRLNR